MVSGRRAHPGLLALLLGVTGGLGEGLDRDPRPGPGAQVDRRGSERDPFQRRNLAPGEPRPPGLAGVAIMELVVRGIVRWAGSREGEGEDLDRAIVETGSGEGFVAGPGDRLHDGVVGWVEDDGVVFLLQGDPDRPVFRPLAVAPTGREAPPQ